MDTIHGIAQTLEQIIGTLEPETLTGFFVLILLLIFVMALVFREQKTFATSAPTLLTTIGILGTFFGIVVGLYGFDVKDIDGSIEYLLAGMKTAFITSLIGILLSVIYKIISVTLFAPRGVAVAAGDKLGVADLYGVMVEQRYGIQSLREAIGGDDESSLTSQVKLLRQEVNDSLKKSRDEFEKFQNQLWENLKNFSDMLSKSATETVIEALNQVIKDFNTNLTEQFGDNFKQLNEAVHKLVEWQENYKNQLEEMNKQYTQGVTAITETQKAVAEIKEDTTKIPQHMERLSEVIAANQHQVNELDRHLQAFAEVSAKAVEAVPRIDSHIERALAGVEQASTKLSEGLSKNADAVVNSAANVSATLGHIDDSFQNMAKNMETHTKSISEEIKASGEALMQEAAKSRQNFESGLETMKEQLFAAIKQVAEQQGQDMRALTIGIRETMENEIRNTQEAVKQQVKALDSAIEHELNESMQQMGNALASITGQFTQDYQKLVTEMNRVINTQPGNRQY